MKKKYILIGASILVVVVTILILMSMKPKLSKPESVVWDPQGNRFLISNSGNGSIMAMDENGKLSEYIKRAFEAPRGLFLQHGKLYVVDPTKVHIVDVASARIMESININDAKALNDIAIGENGTLFVTDTIGNCVFTYNPTSKTQAKIISPLLVSPNGIIYDRPRWQMFVVCSTKHSPVLSIDIRTNDVKIFMDSIYSGLDGIAIDDLGRIYFSSWEDEAIVEIPQEQNRYIVKFKNIRGAADLYYHLPTNELIVPLLAANKIVRVSLNP